MKLMNVIFLASVVVVSHFAKTSTGAERDLDSLGQDLISFIESDVKEKFIFSGLASYYNSVRYAIASEDRISSVDSDGTYTLGDNERLAAIGRFNVLVMTSPNATITISNGSKNIAIDPGEASPKVNVVEKPKLAEMDSVLDGLRYGHLPSLFAWLCKLIEWSLVQINGVVANWGFTIIVYSLLLKVLLVPLDMLTSKLQRAVENQKQLLAPRIKRDQTKSQRRASSQSDHRFAQRAWYFYVLCPETHVRLGD